MHYARIPAIPRTDEGRARLKRLMNELADYWWLDGDLVSHMVKVNQMIQEIIWNGYLMPDFEKVLALMNTLPPEWQAVLDRLWEVNVIPDYRGLVEAFVREYYRIELAKTSTLRLSATWRRVNAPWWRQESSPKVFFHGWQVCLQFYQIL